MVKLNRIYTRTGDKGTTGLVGGARISKHSARINAVGAVDEANSALGFAAITMADTEQAGLLYRIQNDMFDLGADIASPAKDGDDFAPSDMVLRIAAGQVEWLEQAIDAANASLEPLSSFVLPGGCEGAARLHLARAAARRAERAMTELAEREAINPQALAYINRLSDYLFVLARFANAGAGGDVKWVPGQNR